MDVVLNSRIQQNSSLAACCVKAFRQHKNQVNISRVFLDRDEGTIKDHFFGANATDELHEVVKMSQKRSPSVITSESPPDLQ